MTKSLLPIALLAVACGPSSSEVLVLEGEVAELQAASDALMAENDALAARLAALEQAVAATDLEVVTERLADVEADVASNTSGLAATMSDLTGVEAKTAALSATTMDGYPALVVSGVNLYVTDGSGATDSGTGVGNLVLGYNETGDGVCSGGTDDGRNAGGLWFDCTTCESGGGTCESVTRTGSHNLVLGTAHAYTGHSSVVAGLAHQSYGDYAGHLGGMDNIVSDRFAVSSGGWNNQVNGEASVVLAGYGHVADAGQVSILGGNRVTLSQYNAVAP